MTTVKDVIDSLNELNSESSLPKSVKQKIESCIKVLQENVEDHVKVNRALQEIEEIADNANVPSYIRMQLLNIVSLLEAV